MVALNNIKAGGTKAQAKADCIAGKTKYIESAVFKSWRSRFLFLAPVEPAGGDPFCCLNRFGNKLKDFVQWLATVFKVS
eukprot:6174160-Amphidinium_carterae.1